MLLLVKLLLAASIIFSIARTLRAKKEGSIMAKITVKAKVKTCTIKGGGTEILLHDMRLSGNEYKALEKAADSQDKLTLSICTDANQQ